MNYPTPDIFKPSHTCVVPEFDLIPDVESRVDVQLISAEKILIVGQHGVGKTSMIIDEILPNIGNYIILDPNNEYRFKNVDRSRILPIMDIENALVAINNTDIDTTIIFEDTQVHFLRPQSTMMIKSLLEKRCCIITMQSIGQFNASGISINMFDCVYLFPTFDHVETFEQFAKILLSTGVRIELKESWHNVKRYRS